MASGEWVGQRWVRNSFYASMLTVFWHDPDEKHLTLYWINIVPKILILMYVFYENISMIYIKNTSRFIRQLFPFLSRLLWLAILRLTVYDRNE